MKCTIVLTLVYYAIMASAAKTILLSNDDGWASTYIRAAYRDLKDAGYNVILVAPVSQRSGYGGKFDVPTSKTLETDGEFSYVKKGAPSWDHEKDDQNIWYFNGTPASCISFALDYLLPEKFDNVTPDLVVAGPNEGPNLSPGFYTASGTMGAVYNAIYRGIPAISFLGSDFNNSFFKDSLDDSKSNPANIYSKKVVELTKKVIDGGMPAITGINVNFPKVGTLLGKDDPSCDDPKWQFGRMMGKGVFVQNMKYNLDLGLMEWGTKYFDNILKDCDSGDCGLTAEYDIYLKNNCSTSVSVFTVDYDTTLLTSNTVKKLLGF